MSTRAQQIQTQVTRAKNVLHRWLIQANLLQPGEIATIEVSIRFKDKIAQKENRDNTTQLTPEDWEEIKNIHWFGKTRSKINQLYTALSQPIRPNIDDQSAVYISKRLQDLGKPYCLCYNANRRRYEFIKLNREPRSFLASSIIEE